MTHIELFSNDLIKDNIEFINFYIIIILSFIFDLILQILYVIFK